MLLLHGSIIIDAEQGQADGTVMLGDKQFLPVAEGDDSGIDSIHAFRHIKRIVRHLSDSRPKGTRSIPSGKRYTT